MKENKSVKVSLEISPFARTTTTYNAKGVVGASNKKLIFER